MNRFRVSAPVSAISWMDFSSGRLFFLFNFYLIYCFRFKPFFLRKSAGCQTADLGRSYFVPHEKRLTCDISSVFFCIDTSLISLIIFVMIVYRRCMCKGCTLKNI